MDLDMQLIGYRPQDGDCVIIEARRHLTMSETQIVRRHFEEKLAPARVLILNPDLRILRVEHEQAP